MKLIKGLNERGFVHHDLKPANIFFDKNVDKKSGTTTLIDTGMLFKTPKDMETEKHPQYIGGHGGTGLYMHPRALIGQKHGTETDLYAVGVLALEVDHPKAFGHLQAAMTRQNLEPEGITREWLLDQLNAEITKLNQTTRSRKTKNHHFSKTSRHFTKSSRIQTVSPFPVLQWTASRRPANRRSTGTTAKHRKSGIRNCWITSFK